MSLTTEQLLLLWAKSPRGKTDKTLYHPLLCHLIDVAMVARAMWEEVLTPFTKQRIADGLGLSLDDAGVWVEYLAGLHDIGKASPAFQSKWTTYQPVLKGVGLSWVGPSKCPHGQVSTVLIFAELQKHSVRNLALALAAAVGGHHGEIPTQSIIKPIQRDMLRDGQSWREAHQLLFSTLSDVLELPAGTAPTTIDHPTAMVLAGLVSVADWIGSDERFFTYHGTPEQRATFDVTTYAGEASNTAERALRELGWLDWTPTDTASDFDALFPALAGKQRPVQRRIVDLPGITDAPGIVIVELPMGEGKTEAAFYLADRWLTSLGQSGMYIGMPTTATSDQMYSRAYDYLTNHYPEDIIHLQRLHSQAALSIDEEASERDRDELDSRPTDVSDDDEERGANDVKLAVWFTRRKRGLLAPFGVGTVDQALFAALQTKHVFVRLFGLAGKTIIFDEVHAYDVYMSTLFERLLEWLGALGSSVIILSATLPNVRREALLRAYARGAGTPDIGAIRRASYPRLSWFGAAGADSEPVAASPQATRELHLEWIDNNGAEFVAHLQQHLANGGCAVVICNTVGRAQEVYATLKEHFPGMASDGEPLLDLFHARFLYKDRQERQERALRRFGKPKDGEEVRRPHTAVLVATQVVEQSLDLDFDVMVTDFAPLDLLLQRSGRLQRHERGPRTPILTIISPEPDEGGDPNFARSDKWIYSEHVLLRSWVAFQDFIRASGSSIQIPGDIGGLIEAVYDPDLPVPAEQSESIRRRWEASLETYSRDLKQDAWEAHNRWLGSPSASGELAALVKLAREEDAPDLHQQFQALSRLTEPSESLVCLRLIDDKQAASLDGDETFDLRETPTVDLARRLLRHSVTITHGGFVHAPELDEVMPVPKRWQRSQLLQNHRLALLNDDNRVKVGRWVLHVDAEFGIRVEGRETVG